MKRTATLILIPVLLLPALVLGCRSPKPKPPEMPAYKGGQPAVLIELSVDDFSAQNHITKTVEIIRPGSLIVSLGGNRSTGFQWEEVKISAPSVSQESHNLVSPPTTVVGAPGKDVWVFNSETPGAVTISFSYSRPWEGGEKNTWTLTLNVTVK